MSFTHLLTRTWSNGVVSLNHQQSLTSDGEDNRDIAVPGASTDLLVAFALDYSQLQAIFLSCDRDLVIETNSGSAPGNTINLKAGVALVWTKDDYAACPFTVDVTALYLTLASGPAAMLNIRALVDATV